MRGPTIAEMENLARVAEAARLLRTPGGDALAQQCAAQTRQVIETVTLLRAASLYGRAAFRQP